MNRIKRFEITKKHVDDARKKLSEFGFRIFRSMSGELFIRVQPPKGQTGPSIYPYSVARALEEVKRLYFEVDVYRLPPGVEEVLTNMASKAISFTIRLLLSILSSG